MQDEQDDLQHLERFGEVEVELQVRRKRNPKVSSPTSGCGTKTNKERRKGELELTSEMVINLESSFACRSSLRF